MKSGTIEFDGIEYPDGNSSDPNALKWMQGSPPPAAKRIRFEDDRYLEFPQIRWSLSHMRELMRRSPCGAVRVHRAISVLRLAPAKRGSMR